MSSGSPVVTSAETRLEVGDRTRFGKNVVFGANCRSVKVGFGCFLGDDLYIDVPRLEIGDYVTIHRGTTLHGYEPLSIGHNCWIGQFSVLDSIGGTTIGNNVGVGAHSQLWSHIKFGDTLVGCRWNASGPLVVEDDVWFVGHCIVSPIRAAAGSMLMVGSVATRDMEANRVYAGSPAKDITEKVGPQFDTVSPEQRVERFRGLYEEFRETESLSSDDFSIEIRDDLAGARSTPSRTVFDVGSRTYLPTRSDWEYRFMRFLLYDRAKFVPAG